LITRNFSTKVGEIDLIMRDEQHVAFIEVRYRSTSHFGGAVHSITPGKRRKLMRCAKIFLTRRRNWAGYPCRFDVIAYDACNSSSEPRWVRAAFE
jgi:putative endonuclease